MHSMFQLVLSFSPVDAVFNTDFVRGRHYSQRVCQKECESGCYSDFDVNSKFLLVCGVESVRFSVFRLLIQIRVLDFIRGLCKSRLQPPVSVAKCVRFILRRVLVTASGRLSAVPIALGDGLLCVHPSGMSGDYTREVSRCRTGFVRGGGANYYCWPKCPGAGFHQLESG